MTFTNVAYIVQIMTERGLWAWKILEPVQKTVLACNTFAEDSAKSVQSFISAYENISGAYIIVRVNNNPKVIQEEEENPAIVKSKNGSEWLTFNCYLGEKVRPEQIHKSTFSAPIKGAESYFHVDNSGEIQRLKKELEEQKEFFRKKELEEKDNQILELKKKVLELEKELEELEAIIEEYESAPEEQSPFEKFLNGIASNQNVMNAVIAKVVPIAQNETELKKIAGVEETATAEDPNTKKRGRPKKDNFEIEKYREHLETLFAVDKDFIEVLEIIAYQAKKDESQYKIFKNYLKTLPK